MYVWQGANNRVFCGTISVTCSYRGELLGLLAIHLLVRSVVKVNTSLVGSIDIYSDCKTALWTIETLPPTMIPTRFRHADILKLILIHCNDEAVTRRYTHVIAHQDDDEEYEDLSRPSQLNCMMDAKAKQSIRDWDCHGKQNAKR